jgi:hypothetical protein
MISTSMSAALWWRILFEDVTAGFARQLLRPYQDVICRQIHVPENSFRQAGLYRLGGMPTDRRLAVLSRTGLLATIRAANQDSGP